MEQVIFGGSESGIPTTQTRYSSLAGGADWSSSAGLKDQLISTGGVIKNLFIRLDEVPGTGTWTFTLRLNGNPTALTCTVAATETTAFDTTHEVTVSAGDSVGLMGVPSSPDNTAVPRWTTVFKGDTPNESLILGCSSSTLDKTSTEYNHVNSDDLGWSFTTEDQMRVVCPTAGVIENLYVELNIDPGTAPDAYRFTVRLNKATVAQSLIVTITADDTTGNDLAHNLVVAAGDILTLMCEPLNTPSATPRAKWGMTFVADTDGESITMGGNQDDLHNTDTEYNTLSGGKQWSTTETTRYQLAQECTLKKFYVLLSGAPGTSPNRYRFRIRRNGADPASGLEVVISGGSATTGNDTSREIALTDGDTVNLWHDSESTPTVRDAYWGVVGYLEPSVAHEKALADTVTIGDAIVKSPGLVKDDNLAIADTIVKSPALEKDDSLAIADTINTKAIGLNEADSVAIADASAIVAAFERALADSLAITDTLNTKAIGVNKADSIAISDSVADEVEFILSLNDSIAISDAISNGMGLIKADSLAIVDSIIKTVGLIESDSLAITDSPLFVNVFKRAIADTVAIADVISKGVSFPLSDSLAITDAIITASGYILKLADSLAIADDIVKSPGLGKADSLAITDALVKGIGINLDDSLAIIDAIVKSISMPLADTVAITDSVADVVEFKLSLSDTVAIADALVKAVALSKVDTITIADTIALPFKLNLSDSIAISDAVKVAYPVRLAVTIARMRIARMPTKRIKEVEL